MPVKDILDFSYYKELTPFGYKRDCLFNGLKTQQEVKQRRTHRMNSLQPINNHRCCTKPHLLDLE